MTPACTERARGPLRARRGHRPRRLVARVGRAGEDHREHVPGGEHRARQRARHPRRPDGHRRLGVDRAAATKPFGFMPFWPGPGLGGHCIPVDPFYLAWRAKAFDLDFEFVELAGRINVNMPYYAVSRDRAGPQPLGQAAARIARSCSSAWPTSRTSATRARAPRCGCSSCCARRAPRSSYHDPHVPALPDGTRSVALDAADHRRGRLRRHRHGALGDRPGARRRARAPRRRPAQRRPPAALRARRPATVPANVDVL